MTKCFLVQQALRGWKKEHVRMECRRPVSYSLLARLLEATEGQCSSPFEAVLFWACFFFGPVFVWHLVNWSCWPNSLNATIGWPVGG